MISIVICSVNPDDLSRIRENIMSTIGSEYELLVWDNSNVNNGLCEVYNLMAEKARYEYVIFLHEDILFDTNNWGEKIAAIFSKQPEIGVIGVAGSKYKSDMFSGWYTGIKEFDCANITHRYDHGDELQYLLPAEHISIEEVVCLDGVFICVRKSIWQEIKFDQENLNGFHFYDIDFTLRTAKVCTVVVTYEIHIVHITKGGDFGNKWVAIAISYHLFLKDKLPYTKLTELPVNISRKISKTWLDVLKNYNISWRNKWKWIIYQKLYSTPDLFYSTLKFVLYKPLGLKFIHKVVKKK